MEDEVGLGRWCRSGKMMYVMKMRLVWEEEEDLGR